MSSRSCPLRTSASHDVECTCPSPMLTLWTRPWRYRIGVLTILNGCILAGASSRRALETVEEQERCARSWLSAISKMTRLGLPLSLVFPVGSVALFVLYLYTSRFVTNSSDNAGIILEAQAMAHGNLILHGWHLPPDSFITTEMPLDAVLSAFFRGAQLFSRAGLALRGNRYRRGLPGLHAGNVPGEDGWRPARAWPCWRSRSASSSRWR